MKAKVYITLREGILDPQGAAVGKTLRQLDYENVGSVRIGKYVELEIAETDSAVARTRVEEMCRRLIANPVMEDFRVEIEE